MNKAHTVPSIAVVSCLSLAILFSSAEPGFSSDEHGYVSSRGCGMCHKDEKAEWAEHGHAFMLRKIDNGALDGVDVTPPPGSSWADITYLIGGYKNYARFTDAQGYVMTGEQTNWSLDGKVHTPFKPDIPNGTLEYSCIKCHVVGWKESGVYEDGAENTLAGIPGVWFENSVGCEACHGPGHEHVIMKDKKKIKENDKKADLKIIDTKDADMCGQCHKRTDDNSVIVVAADLTQSRQQFAEWKHSRKAKFRVRCVDCHNPHASSTSENGFVRACEDCHKGKFAMPVQIAAMQDLACTDCQYADCVPRSL